MNFLSFLVAGYALFGQPFVPAFIEAGDIGGGIGGEGRARIGGAPGGGSGVGIGGGIGADIGVDIGVDVDKADLRICCEKILRDPPRIWFVSDRNGKMKLQVRGIYIHGQVLLFLLRMTNRSPKDFSVGDIRFIPVDKDGSRIAGRAALEPVFIYDSTKIVPGNSNAASIFVVPRLTLPPGGKLWIEVRETSGGRLLHIPLGNWTLARARLI